MIDFNYSLIRSKRRTISIIVKNNGEVVVRAPLKVSQNEIDKFVLQKSVWVKKHIVNTVKRENDFERIISFKTVLVKGNEIPLEFGNKNLLTGDKACVSSLSKIKKIYLEHLGEEFLSKFNALCGACNLTCNSVEFKSYKSRWGCCNRDKKITFNYKLLMLPERLWRLVMAHELCHTVYMNHSRQFHLLLSTIIPDCKILSRELKNYSIICRLY